jgi:hypothetical protein
MIAAIYARITTAKTDAGASEPVGLGVGNGDLIQRLADRRSYE